MLKRLLAVMAAVMLLSLCGTAGAADDEQGVYVRMLSGLKADISSARDRVVSALEGAGYEVLASFENGVPEGCAFRAVTVVFTKAAYADKVLASGPDKGFALPLRMELYEDEGGLNIAMMNPVSIDRTVFEGGSMDGPARAVVDEVTAALDALGAVSPEQIGQIRKTGEIRGIGGGRFSNKVDEVAATGKTVAGAAGAIEKGFSDTGGWYSVYSYSPKDGLAIIGVANKKTEGRSFGIAGERREEDDYRFPGIDHAAAYPIEILVYKDGGRTKVFMLASMWRMKLYFEDAGNWAFMKNMTMPGHIQNEIEEVIKASLK